MTLRSQALFIGGRSGVGKTTVAFEVHTRLSTARVRHCLIEGDNLDQAYPAPWEHGLAERNLAAMWANYRALGYRRMVYTNTASVFRGGGRRSRPAGRARPRPYAESRSALLGWDSVVAVRTSAIALTASVSGSASLADGVVSTSVQQEVGSGIPRSGMWS